MVPVEKALQGVLARIAAAARAAGRDPAEVTLLAVSKTFPAAAIREAYAAGLRAFGEYYVQEGAAKRAELADLPGLRLSLAYASSKSALIGLTQGLAIQLSPYEITVNAVCPGLIDTPIWHRGAKVMDLPPGSMIKMVVDTAIEQRQLKIARVGTPDDIAAAVSFLVIR